MGSLKEFVILFDERRIYEFDVPFWNIKLGRHTKAASGVHRAGVAMLSSVLRSKRAVSVNIEIMRAFVRLRQMLSTNGNLERRLNELEKKYDSQFKVVFEAIRQLMAKPEPDRKKIGFRLKDRHSPYMAKVKRRNPN